MATVIGTIQVACPARGCTRELAVPVIAERDPDLIRQAQRAYVAVDVDMDAVRDQVRAHHAGADVHS